LERSVKAPHSKAPSALKTKIMQHWAQSARKCLQRGIREKILLKFAHETPRNPR
jgi:hypothetical protein